MKVKIFTLVSALIMVLIFGGGLAFAIYTDYSNSLVLSQAYEAYLTELLDAQVKRDASRLPEVAVDPQLSNAARGIDAREHFTQIASEEFRNVKIVEVVRFGQSDAIVRVRYDYRPFSQGFNTSVRIYGPTGRWFWREEKIIMEKEGGIWKVKEIYFIDWSG